MLVSSLEEELCKKLRDLPKAFENRYTNDARRALVEALFRSLAGNNEDHLKLFFPGGPPSNKTEVWSLRDAQGAVEGAEYSAAARGHPCGHILKSGEPTYRCRTCTVDDTCVLCARCFDASDHEGHAVFVSISPGNSGCCDCGDDEAWQRPVHCNIHTALPGSEPESKSAGKAKEGPAVPEDVLKSIRTTVARALDYICDVFSCSPEQLRLPKTEDSIRKDEELSRLTSKWYGGEDIHEPDQEFALVLWNDEKHTVEDVENQVARACKQTKKFGRDKAYEVDDVGRSVITYSTDVKELLKMATIIEHIKLTVTIRSARDTFREQMCGTIVEWISDIAGCSVAEDNQVLRNIICEEMLKSWRMGSEAHHLSIGRDGLDDHEAEEAEDAFAMLYARYIPRRRIIIAQDTPAEDDEDDDDEDWDEEEDPLDTIDDEGEEDDEMQLDEFIAGPAAPQDVDMEGSDGPDTLEASEATFAGYPPPPPPPPAPRRRDQIHTPVDSDGESLAFDQVFSEETPPIMEVPKTPKIRTRTLRPPRPAKYWNEKPEGYRKNEDVPLHEDLWQRVRLDFMILYDLRMWKKVRIDIRDVFIGTVVTIPYFKRVLGLRFAALYTTLAQLYLIADREPDHSIINLSLQMLTTPTITAEVVDRGNFLTNLMAILYTFLTTRQVGYPSDVNPMATLAFDQGAVTNRRMYHFFMDMKYLLGSEYVQERICQENRYLLQFLDLIKLHQGICPNVRAIGEHIEYETDAWISASLITREINKLCRQFAESFMSPRDSDPSNVCRAIRSTAKTVIIHSLGAERKRFNQAELKGETRFKVLEPFEADGNGPTYNWPKYKVVDFVVEREPMSFHHALHYTLSWLIDRGKGMPREKLLGLLLFSAPELKEPPAPPRVSIPEHQPEEYLLAMFDFPLRVCAWLSQMRASMWVRNGITLRHQMTTYRGVTQRDNSHQRDIFLLQVALVICPTAAFLAQMIDRYGMSHWVRGSYAVRPGYEDMQTVDVAEDFVHLLIILLSDRHSLLPPEVDPNPLVAAARRDIAHTLCFKPMPYSDLTSRFSERLQDSDEFSEMLEEMTVFKPPEGVSDSGTFVLKEQYIEEIDPYIAHYNRNSREEAENIYKNYVAKKTGKDPAEIVFQPKLRKIETGVFQDLPRFTKLPLFSQLVYYFLGYAFAAPSSTPNVPMTRVETFIQFVLQLLVIVVNEEADASTLEGDSAEDSFMKFALFKNFSPGATNAHPTIVSMLHALADKEDFKSCEAKIRLILSRIQHKYPMAFDTAMASINLGADRMDTASPASLPAVDKENKKKQALERQARVMAQFKEQQTSFMANQDIDWGEDEFSDMDEDTETPAAREDKSWKYPSGTCILCQEETSDQRLYGTFGFIGESNILRQTDTSDADWVAEAAETPVNLDRSADHLRPFGVSGHNRRKVEKVTYDGKTIVTERQDLSKGFPPTHVRRGPVSTGCGHIMHFHCFELYNQATHRRHHSQIARHHPERPHLNEFLCPLCKALGNAFLPIIWDGKTITYPGVLEPDVDFDNWLESHVSVQVSKLDKGPERPGTEAAYARQQNLFFDYGNREIIPTLSSDLAELATDNYLSLPPLASSRNPGLAAIPAMFRPPEDEIQVSSLADAPTLRQGPTTELVRIYQRLRDTMRLNCLQTRYTYANGPPIVEDLTYTDSLARSLGFSISAVEIAQRGIESEVGCTLLDKIPSQSLTHLRVLSETASSYLAIGGIRHQGATKTNQEFKDSQARQLNQLMFGHPLIDSPSQPLGSKNATSLLQQDPFVFLAESSVCLVPALRLDIYHVMRLCYLAEIIKVLTVHLVAQPDSSMLFGGKGRTLDVPPANFSDEQMSLFTAFAKRVVEDSHEAASEWEATFNRDKLAWFLSTEKGAIMRRYIRRLVDSYALPFVRKTAILMHVRYGIEFPDAGYDSAKEPELTRLSKVLRLPSLDEIFAHYLADGQASLITRSIAQGWIKHWMCSRGDDVNKKPLTLSHPAIFELVGLPRNYDTLTDEAIKRKCPSSGKDLTDPSVCLFCGEIFCSQAVCCLKDKKGGCIQHQAKCGAPIGLFINIRKCMLLLTHDDKGSWFPAPYLDKHGETDMSLRRHHQLYLHQKRYDKLVREVWLSHGVPSTIARKLDGDINNGGWETL
ncbi:hypothetical protein K490DRAFT_51742 [Saccharata proteae CBS 121410]|uniref:E3 ubiquitin-protein ligase n=1 Tax=Saccharata proteae CBS 121410 TaxID=1314787 RepID=A0A9P4LT58_9PEZI|nr:hypothetical protein K490DRAFT_51742 [Saccharata proteae CBS 121410]